MDVGFLLIIALLLFVVYFAVWQAFARVRPGFLGELSASLKGEIPRTWIVGGMMGSGKSTFAQSLSKQINLVHIEIDRYSAEDDVLFVARKSAAGWIAEANPWQIPASLTQVAEVVVFLDYPNTVNYVRLLFRGYKEWKGQKFSYSGFRTIIIDKTLCDLGRIVYQYGAANREGWRKNGMFGANQPASQVLVRCISPAELTLLSQFVVNESQKNSE